MPWGSGEWSWAGWLAMTVSMGFFSGLFAWGVTSLARRPANHGPTADQILDERFARGDTGPIGHERGAALPSANDDSWRACRSSLARTP